MAYLKEKLKISGLIEINKYLNDLNICGQQMSTDQH